MSQTRDNGVKLLCNSEGSSQMSVATDVKTTTFRSAVYKIRKKIEDASLNAVHVYSFNVAEDELKSAHDLLDKEEGRRAMRVTYSLDHNFIVRYMPSLVHQATARYWDYALNFYLNRLITIPLAAVPPGCVPIGSTTLDFGQMKKQPDGGVCPTGSKKPSVVLEVGSSESIRQLQCDARLWLERSDYVNLVVLVCIDPPLPPSTTPRITFQLWRPVSPIRLSRPGSDARTRVAQVVQDDDWTVNETPVRILLSDIFGVQVPAAYGAHNYVDIDTQWLRQSIIDVY